MGRYRPLAGAGIGALVMVVATVAFAWFATAPDHYEWTDPAVFMSPVTALIGAYIGAALGHLSRRREQRHLENHKNT